MLQIRGLTKRYGDREVLRGVDLDVPAGRIVALLGVNGAGKTTLVSIVAGLRPATSGTVTVDGVDALRHPDRVRSRLGRAPQELGVYPRLTVRQNLSLFGALGGVGRRETGRRVDEVAEALDLVPLLDRPAGRLSGGQQRRLHTGMALVHRPRLVFLDEPTVGADVRSRAQLLEAVRALADDGVAVVYATHYLPEIEALGAEVAVLADGRVVARGTVDELVGRHGGSSLRLRFRGAPPEVPGGRADGDVVVVPATDPAAELTGVVRHLGADADRLVDVEIHRPSLESAFLALIDAPTSGATVPTAA